MLDNLFELFIKEKQYIQNCSPNTITYYRQSYYKVYRKYLDDRLPTREKLITPRLM